MALWSEDSQWTYKSLFVCPRDGAIGVSVASFNVSPFDALQESKGVTWRVQAFEHGWAQAVARFRQWREREIHLLRAPIGRVRFPLSTMG